MAQNKETGAQLTAQCPCGAASLAIEAMPTVRFYCHCTICQSVYPGDYGDATLMRADKVSVRTPGTITFTRHLDKGGLERGTCSQCNHPVVAFMNAPMMPKFAFVPAAVLPDRPDKPSSTRHIFYGTRARDVHDALPKTEGDAASMMVFTPSVLKVAFGR